MSSRRHNRRCKIAVSTLVMQAVFQGAFMGIVSLVVYTRAVAFLGATRMPLPPPPYLALRRCAPTEGFQPCR